MIILGSGPGKGGSVFIADDAESPETSEFDSCVVKVFLMVRNVRRSLSLWIQHIPRGHCNGLEDRKVVAPKQKLAYCVSLRCEREKYGYDGVEDKNRWISTKWYFGTKRPA